MSQEDDQKFEKAKGYLEKILIAEQIFGNPDTIAQVNELVEPLQGLKDLKDRGK